MCIIPSFITQTSPQSHSPYIYPYSNNQPRAVLPVVILSKVIFLSVILPVIILPMVICPTAIHLSVFYPIVILLLVTLLALFYHTLIHLIVIYITVTLPQSSITERERERKRERERERERERLTDRQIDRQTDIGFIASMHNLHKGQSKVQQVTRGHNIVAGGWAGASNPHPHPKPHSIHKHT